MASPAIGTGTGEVQTASTGGATSLAITTPTNAVTNDLLIAYIDTTTVQSVTSSGWTSIVAGTEGTLSNEAELFYRYHDGSSSSYTFSWSGSVSAQGGIVRVTGAATSSPVDVSASKTNNSFGTSQVAPSVTTTVADTLLLCLFANSSGYTYTTPSGMTEVTDANGGSLHKLAVAATGATGTKTATMSSSGWAIGLSVAIKPPAAVNATVTPAAIVTSVTVPSVTVALSKTVTQTAIAATASLPAATVVANSTVTPAVIATSVTVPAVTVTAGADRTPDTIAATVTVPQAIPRDGTVLTVYADATNAGRVYGADATYATARSTAGASSVDGLVGQVFVGATYYCDELFLEFDTSAIPDGAVITSAVLSLYGKTNEAGTAFNVIAAIRDYGTTLETGDYVAGASLSGLTTVASFASSGFTTSGYNDFADVALPANVDKTGVTRLILYSDRQAAGTAPSGFERLEFFLSNEAGTFRDPQLVVVYTDSVPATVTPAAIATSVALLQASVTAGADRTPDTIAATVALPAPTVNAAATVTPAAIATTVTVPQADPIESSPVTINAVVTVPQVSVSTGWTATPTVIVATVAVPAATAAQGADRTPAAIVTTVTLPAATASASSTVTPAAIVTTVAVPQATAAQGADLTPAVIATTATLSAVTVTAGATVTPAAIATSVTAPQVTVDTAANATPTPGAVATTVTVPAVTVIANATVTPATITATAALPAATVLAAATVAPGTIAATTSTPTAGPSADSAVTPATVATVATLPSGAVLASWTATPAYIAAVVAVGQVIAGAADEWAHSVPTVTGQARSAPTTDRVRSVPTVKQMATSSPEVK